ncbi:hypothetical protein [Nitrosophilus alvini]|uniref:hypothetical protein n=1 Tax=Nitrosophilus alvini TaxID=2714855 RepID=UPI00190C5256|nr:hypothetical protein [Nitrosophilus alvini]
MQFEIGKRYSAKFFIPRKCNELNILKEFVFLFSLKVYDIKSDFIVFTALNPIESIKIFKKNSKFYVYLPKEERFYEFILLDKESEKIKAKMSDSGTFKERREFERFSLCPERFGAIEIFKEGIKLTDKGYIDDISACGVKIRVEELLDLESVDRIDIYNKKEDFRINLQLDVVSYEKDKDQTIIRGKILSSNTNMMRLLAEVYIEMSKDVMKKGYKIG